MRFLSQWEQEKRSHIKENKNKEYKDYYNLYIQLKVGEKLPDFNNKQTEREENPPDEWPPEQLGEERFD